MKIYKRIIVSIFTLTMTLTMLTSCGETAETPAESKGETTTTTTAEQTEAQKTTTTTEAIEDSEPETTKKEATTTITTTEPVEDSEPEVEVTTMADNSDGMYPMEECFRRVIEESTNSKVISINIIEGLSSAITEDGHKFMLAPGEISVYYNGELTNINDYVISESFLDEFDGMVSYSPNADKNV